MFYFHYLPKLYINISLNKKEWICSLFKEWILEKSEIRVNLEWTFCVIHSFWSDHRDHSMQGFRVIPEVTPKWVNNTNVHSKFTHISFFSKIHSLKSEHIHSFLFRDYYISFSRACNSACIQWWEKWEGWLRKSFSSGKFLHHKYNSQKETP